MILHIIVMSHILNYCDPFEFRRRMELGTKVPLLLWVLQAGQQSLRPHGSRSNAGNRACVESLRIQRAQVASRKSNNLRTHLHNVVQAVPVLLGDGVVPAA